MLAVTGYGLIKSKMPVNIFFFLLFVITGLAYSTAGQTASGLFFIAGSLLAGLLMILNLKDPVLRYTILTFLMIRIGLALVQAYSGINLPGAGADSATFEKEAWENAQAWLYGGETGRTTGAYYYSSIIGVLYIFFGRFEFIPQLVNVYLSLITLVVIYLTTYCVTASLNVSRFAMLILAVMPALNSFSAILLRDTMIIFVMILSFYYLARWLKEGRLLWVGWSFLALVTAGLLHGPLFLLLGIHLFFLCFFSPAEQRFRLVFWQLIPAAILIFIAFLLLGEYITYQLPRNIADIITPDFMRHVVERKTTGRSSYLLDTVPYTFFDLAWQTPLRIIYFIFAPFPWMLENFRDALGFFDVVIYVVLFYFAFRGGRKLWKANKQVVLALVMAVVSLVVMFAWGTTNYGTAWRHRQKIAPYVIVLAAVGVGTSRKLQYLISKDDIILGLPGEEISCQK